MLYASQVVIWDTSKPRNDAARALLALGVRGKVALWRGDKVVSTMYLERAAELTIVENANVGPALGRWKAFADDYVAPPAAVSGRPGVPGACQRGRPLVRATAAVELAAADRMRA